MSLTTDEMQRVRRELQENVLDIGAEPYFWHKRIFDIIASNVSASATAATSSSTAVARSDITAATVTLTLGSVSGLSVGTMVQLDVDQQRETCMVRAVSGSTISVVPTKIHGGTYPVEIESARTMVRGVLSDLSAIQQEINLARRQMGVKKADEVEFFGDGSFAATRVAQLRQEQANLRMDLARMCGLGGLLRRNSGGSGAMEVY